MASRFLTLLHLSSGMVPLRIATTCDLCRPFAGCSEFLDEQPHTGGPPLRYGLLELSQLSSRSRGAPLKHPDERSQSGLNHAHGGGVKMNFPRGIGFGSNRTHVVALFRRNSSVCTGKPQSR